MAAIEVDFDVYKELTLRRPTESVTYNDVIRNLLGLGAPTTPAPASRASGCVFKGVHFPEGTQFRVTYKGKTYLALIKGGEWIDGNGVPRNSPSEAAHAITQTNVNGWRFWECKRPSDTDWRLLDALRPD